MAYNISIYAIRQPRNKRNKMATEITKITQKENGLWLCYIKHNGNNYRFMTTNRNAINKENGEGDENLIAEFMWVCKGQIEERES